MSPSSLICHFSQRDAVKWVRNFFGVKDINNTGRRLDRLLEEEGRAVGAEGLGAVQSE